MKSYRSPTGCERAGFESITHCQAPLGEVPLEQKGSWSTEEFQSGAGLRLPASVGSNPRYTWNHPPWHPPHPPWLGSDPLSLWTLVASGVPFGKVWRAAGFEHPPLSPLPWRRCWRSCRPAALFLKAIIWWHQTAFNWMMLRNVLLPKLIWFGICFPCGVTRTWTAFNIFNSFISGPLYLK